MLFGVSSQRTPHTNPMILSKNSNPRGIASTRGAELNYKNAAKLGEGGHNDESDRGYGGSRAMSGPVVGRCSVWQGTWKQTGKHEETVTQ